MPPERKRAGDCGCSRYHSHALGRVFTIEEGDHGLGNEACELDGKHIAKLRFAAGAGHSARRFGKEALFLGVRSRAWST